MPTKRYLQDRVDQLQKELERVARERDAARAEPAGISDSVTGACGDGRGTAVGAGSRRI